MKTRLILAGSSKRKLGLLRLNFDILKTKSTSFKYENAFNFILDQVTFIIDFKSTSKVEQQSQLIIWLFWFTYVLIETILIP